MPLYKFKCPECGKIEDNVVIRASDYCESAFPRCYACDEIMKVVVSATPFVLKGDGWTQRFYLRDGEGR